MTDTTTPITPVDPGHELDAFLDIVRSGARELFDRFNLSVVEREAIAAELSQSLSEVRTDADLKHIEATFLNRLAVRGMKAEEAARELFALTVREGMYRILKIGSHAIVGALVI